MYRQGESPATNCTIQKINFNRAGIGSKAHSKMNNETIVAEKEIKRFISLALSKPTVADLACQKLLEMIDFRDDYLC